MEVLVGPVVDDAVLVEVTPGRVVVPEAVVLAGALLVLEANDCLPDAVALEAAGRLAVAVEADAGPGLVPAVAGTRRVVVVVGLAVFSFVSEHTTHCLFDERKQSAPGDLAAALAGEVDFLTGDSAFISGSGSGTDALPSSPFSVAFSCS